MRILASASIFCLLTSGFLFKKDAPQVFPTNANIIIENNINASYLTDKRGWKLQNITCDKPCDTNNDGIMTTKTITEMPACSLDDILFIEKNSPIAYYKRGEPCCDDPKNNTYNWSLKEDILTLSQDGNDDPMHIESLTDTQMRVTTKMEAQGEVFTFTVTFIH